MTDHISHNIANRRLNFGHSVNQDVIFGLCNFYLLLLLQSQDIENVPKLIIFSILGFFRLGVKLRFDFPRVSPNQKSQTRSLKFDFDEERNPMSLKNSSSIKIPNFQHQKLKMPKIKLCFDRNMCPSIESQPSLVLLMDYGERPKW